MSIAVTINKFDLKRLSNKMDSRKLDKIVRRSLFQSAIFLKGWVKDKRLSGPRPRVLGVVTGRLRASIVASPVKKTREGYVVKIGTNREGYVAKIGTNVVYARIHEYGGQTGRGYAVKMPARPFLRPAIEDSRNIKLIEGDLKRNINIMLGV